MGLPNCQSFLGNTVGLNAWTFWLQRDRERYCENVRSGKSWSLDYTQTKGEVRKKKKKNGGESGRKDRAS